MSKRVKTIVLVAVFAIFLGGAAILYNTLSAEVEPDIGLAEKEAQVSDAPAERGPLAPDFTAVDSNGNEVKLSDFQGRPVVLNFWASWCPPCKAEMPDFDKVWAEVGDDVAFLMVNMTDGQRETVEAGAAFIAEGGYSFPVYYDTNQEAAYQYGVSSIPTTYFLDDEGYVVTGSIGMISEENLRKGIGMITGTGG